MHWEGLTENMQCDHVTRDYTEKYKHKETRLEQQWHFIQSNVDLGTLPHSLFFFLMSGLYHLN